jgi:hypothetical protein
MRRTATVVGLIIIVVALTILSIQRLPAQQQVCLHGPPETADQAARRKSALGFTRHVNTLQARAFGERKAYQAADQLPITQPLPDGFVFQMAATP